MNRQANAQVNQCVKKQSAVWVKDWVSFKRTNSCGVSFLWMSILFMTASQTYGQTPSASAAGVVLPLVQVTDAKEEQPSTERTGSYTLRKSKSATGLNLSPRETPQSVSVVTRAQMDDFGLRSANDALDAATGVVVERTETDRTYYTARGFDITNFQVDGLALPLVYGLTVGDLDTSIYDRVEVMRGADGLLSGTGNPSATINFIRKRPTAKFQSSAQLSVGSWNDQRLEVDVSGALNQAGSVRGRLVTAAQDKNSWLDRYHHKKDIVYGVMEADLGDKTVLTLGHTQQNSKARGNLWGALPLYTNTGAQMEYDQSASPAPEWTRWEINTNISFLEALHYFDNGWELKTALTHKVVEDRAKLFYITGQPNLSTNQGLDGLQAAYRSDTAQRSLDARLSGTYRLGGREHDLMFGHSTAHTRQTEKEATLSYVSFATSAILAGDIVEPLLPDFEDKGSFTDRQRSFYAASRINLADSFKLILGANHTTLKTSGITYDTSRQRNNSKTTPYLGALYDVTPGVSVYASYTGIFNPQKELDSTLNRLAPATGKNLEAGVKSEWLDKKLNTSLALFKARQNNLATYVSFDTTNNVSIYEGVDTLVRGVELDMAGQISPRWKLTAGYTQLSIKTATGEEVRTFSPRRVFRLATTYQIPALESLKVGASINWRGQVWRQDEVGGTAAIARQPSYALVNLLAGYDINKQLNIALNVNNVTNKKYLTSLYWDQSYYGAPRNAVLSLRWKY